MIVTKWLSMREGRIDSPKQIYTILDTICGDLHTSPILEIDAMTRTEKQIHLIEAHPEL